jgi:hypothetical protein
MPDRSWFSRKFSNRRYMPVIKRKHVDNTDLRKEKKGLDPIVKFQILKI